MRGAADTETTGLNVWQGCQPFIVSYYNPQIGRKHWRLRVDPFTRAVEQPRGSVRRALRECFTDPSVEVAFFNAKFDIFMLESIGIEVKCKIHEVSYKVKACTSMEKVYALKPLCKKYLDISDLDEITLRKSTIIARRVAKKLGWNIADCVEPDYWIAGELKNRHRNAWRAAGMDKYDGACEEYAEIDAWRTWRLDKLFDYGIDDLGVRSVYEMEMALLPITMGMERFGVTIDKKRIRRLAKECARKRDNAVNMIRKASEDQTFNINSAQQVAWFFFGVDTSKSKKYKTSGAKTLNLEAVEMSRGGLPSTGAGALQPYKHLPIVNALLAARSNAKALSSFFESYQELAIDEPGRGYVLHPGYRQWGALTGRYSCASPNLQNVSDPTNTSSKAAEFVIDVRQAFIPPDGYNWYCIDYNQVEVIIFADMTREKHMMNAIRVGNDLHTATAQRIWGGKNNELAIRFVADSILRTSDRKAAKRLLARYNWDIVHLEAAYGGKTRRKLAKTATFTKIYGGGANALMGWVGCSRAEAFNILSAYDNAFPDMVRAIQDICEKARKHGYVVNPFGRRIDVDRFSDYKAVNYIAQSTAADLMKRAMINVDRFIRETGIDARIAMTIHDEIILEIARKHCFKSVLKKIMGIMADSNGAISIPTPVSIDIVRGRWSRKESVDI